MQNGVNRRRVTGLGGRYSSFAPNTRVTLGCFWHVSWHRDAGVLVWQVGVGFSPAGGGVKELLSRLDDVDLAVILPAGLFQGQGPSSQEWFEIGL